MANAPAPVGIAPRYQKPPTFGGTDVTWRVLCDLYPSAETPEIIQAVVEYCAARRLDPLRKPVHIVPMWNAKLRRKVQVVMQGINEIETTAHRTRKWAGMDEPKWGPIVTRTFRGTAEDERGGERAVEVTMKFPEWCSVTVYRIVEGERRAFSEPVFWEEAYGHAGFRSEVPNARWQQAPRQMVHKCAKSAALRAAFPEEGLGYAAEEMEDREVDTGGVTIEGKIDHGDPGLTDHDRRIGQTPPSGPVDDATDPLDEPNGTQWLKNLDALLARAKTRQEVLDLQGDVRVVRVREADKTPSLIKGRLDDMFAAAFDRVTAPPDESPMPEDPGSEWDDPIGELLDEVATMDLIRINALATDASWRARVRDATALPLDQDRLDEAIAARKAALQGRS